MKESSGDFFGCWGGIASLQISLPAIWTGARQKGLQPELIVEWMSVAPARLAGLERTKARIAEGFDADLTIWNPDKTFVVDAARLRHRHPVTPYAGRTLYGSVEATFVAGERVFQHL
jgi:allantoinase